MCNMRGSQTQGPSGKEDENYEFQKIVNHGTGRVTHRLDSTGRRACTTCRFGGVRLFGHQTLSARSRSTPIAISCAAVGCRWATMPIELIKSCGRPRMRDVWTLRSRGYRLHGPGDRHSRTGGLYRRHAQHG